VNIYYVAGVPYSDELYHHGIKGQKWYIRRFQNEDGSLTPLGRIRYGAGNVAKKAGRGVVNAVKNRHPSLMTDDELAQRTDRLRREAEYQRQRVASGRVNENNNQNRQDGVFRTMGRRFALTTSDALIKRFAERIAGGHEVDIRDIARGRARAQDVQLLSSLMNARNTLEGIRQTQRQNEIADRERAEKERRRERTIDIRNLETGRVSVDDLNDYVTLTKAFGTYMGSVKIARDMSAKPSDKTGTDSNKDSGAPGAPDFGDSGVTMEDIRDIFDTVYRTTGRTAIGSGS